MSLPIGQEEIKNLVNDAKEKRMRLKGLIPIGNDKKAGTTTYRRYATDIVIRGLKNGLLSICANDNVTTDLRNTAGNSLRSTMSFICAVCDSHFIIGSPPPNSSFFNLHKRLSPGVKKTIKMIERCLKVPVFRK